ncbi:dentin sialophosphoprotein-like, partial [Penaeus japonicus]|uniref:dentin sialophosphoprotein-like n=1 Tax=Penaeus japonicus TaxID=27405 RepID=UPI001C70CEAA
CKFIHYDSCAPRHVPRAFPVVRVGSVTLALVAACSAWPTFLPEEKRPHPAPGFSFHSNSTSSNSSSSSNQNSASSNYTSSDNGFNFSHSSSNSSSSSADHSSSSSFSGFFSGGNSGNGASFFGNNGNKFPFGSHAGGQPSFFDFHSLFAGGQVPSPGVHASSVGNEGASSSTQLSSASDQGSFSNIHGNQGSQSTAGVPSAGTRTDRFRSPVNTQDSPSFTVTTSNPNTVTPSSSFGTHFTTTGNPVSSTADTTVYFQPTTFAPTGSTHKSFSHFQLEDGTDAKSRNFASGHTAQESSLNTQSGPQISTVGTHGLLTGKHTTASDAQDLESDKNFAFGLFHFQTSTHRPTAVSFLPDTQEAVTPVAPSGLNLPLDGFEKDRLDLSTGRQDSSAQLEIESQTHQNDTHGLTDVQQSYDSLSNIEDSEFELQPTGVTLSTDLQQPSFDNQDSGVTTKDFLHFHLSTDKAHKPEFLPETGSSDIGNKETLFGFHGTTGTSDFGTANSETPESVDFQSVTNNFESGTLESAADTDSAISNTGSSNEYQTGTNVLLSTQAPSSDIPASSSANQFDYDNHNYDSTTHVSTPSTVPTTAFQPFSPSTGDLAIPESHSPSTVVLADTGESTVETEVPSSDFQSDFGVSFSVSQASAPEFQFNTGSSGNQDYDSPDSSFSELPNTHSGILDSSVKSQESKSSTHDAREMASGSESVPNSRGTVEDIQSNIHDSPAETQGFFGLHSGSSISTQDQSFQSDLPSAIADYDTLGSFADTQEAAYDIQQDTFGSVSDTREASDDFDHRTDGSVSDTHEASNDYRIDGSVSNTQNQYYQDDIHDSAPGVTDLTHDFQHGTHESQSGHNSENHSSYSSSPEPSTGVPSDVGASASKDSFANQFDVDGGIAGFGTFYDETERDSATAIHGISSDKHGSNADDQDSTTGIQSSTFINFDSPSTDDYDLLVDGQGLTKGDQEAATGSDFSSTDSQNLAVNNHASSTRETDSNNPSLSTDSYTHGNGQFSVTDNQSIGGDQVSSTNKQSSSANTYDSTTDIELPSTNSQISTDENQFSSGNDNTAVVNQFSSGDNHFLSTGNQFSSAANQFSSDDYDSFTDNQFLTSTDYDSTTDNQFSSSGNQFPATVNQFFSSDDHDLATDSQSPSADNQYSSSSDYDSAIDNQFITTDNQFTSDDNQFSSGSSDPTTDNRFLSSDNFDSTTDSQISSSGNHGTPPISQISSSGNHGTPPISQISSSGNHGTPPISQISSSGNHGTPPISQISASGSQGSLFAFTSSGQASGSSSSYVTGYKPSSLGHRSGSGAVGGSGLTGFIVHLTSRGSVHAGSCPTLRKDCSPSKSAPNKCLNDSSCGPSEKCCFDTCSTALWVCTTSVLPA